MRGLLFGNELCVCRTILLHNSGEDPLCRVLTSPERFCLPHSIVWGFDGRLVMCAVRERFITKVPICSLIKVIGTMDEL